MSSSERTVSLRLRATALALSAATLMLAAPADAASPAVLLAGLVVAEDGERMFQRRCASCHAVSAGERPAMGPHLENVIGRRAGTIEGYGFSAALRDWGGVWDEASLDTYLEAPSRAVPGTRMTMGARNPEERASIIAYLRSMQGR